jgi:hypothetical protein
MRIAFLLVACVGPILLACSEAVLSLTRIRTHDAYSDASYAAYERARDGGAVTKAEVLAMLGPPIQVIGQEDGDIFVYRRDARDSRVLHLNPSMVSLGVAAPPIPIYYNSRTSGRDDTLMIFFDAEGRSRGQGLRLDVEPGS